MMVRGQDDWVFQQYVREISKPKLQPTDFYWENGKMIMTEEYHKRRGTCCGNSCRHCPYEPKAIKGNKTLK
jgi:hypothetical protein